MWFVKSISLLSLKLMSNDLFIYKLIMSGSLSTKSFELARKFIKVRNEIHPLMINVKDKSTTQLFMKLIRFLTLNGFFFFLMKKRYNVQHDYKALFVNDNLIFNAFCKTIVYYCLSKDDFYFYFNFQSDEIEM